MARFRQSLISCSVLALLGACVAAEPWAGTADAPERTPESVRIATYNAMNLFDDVDDPMLEGDADDCHSYDKTVRAKPAAQCAALAEAIDAIDADVVAMEEVESYDALNGFRAEYLEGMGYDYIASVDVGYYRGVEQSVISRYPIKEIRVWPMKDLGTVHPELWNGRPNRDAGERLEWRRSPLMVTVEVPAGAKGNDEAYELTLFVVHHKSGRGNDYWREAEAENVIELVADRLEDDPQANVVVLGDFNAQKNDESVRMYLEAGMHDIFDWSDKSGDALLTHESGRRIDFVLVSETMASEVVDGSPFVYGGVPIRDRGANWRTTDPPAGYASDHLPVVVDIVPVDR